MKNYSYKWFKDEDQMLEWLNRHQEINVISIIYLEPNLSYRVFYYIEEKERAAYQPNNDGYRSPLYGGTYGSGAYNSYE